MKTTSAAGAKGRGPAQRVSTPPTSTPHASTSKRRVRNLATRKFADPPVASGKAKKRSVAIAPEARQRYIAEAAYFIAEREGFPAGREFEHWRRAEAEIERIFASMAP